MARSEQISPEQRPRQPAAQKSADRRWPQWQEENRAAIEANNKRIEEEGLWSDGLRLF
jgi:hypothetical protein